ncbi:MAG: VWA domain-containing protein, partial [Ilumatobacter sp.]
MTILRQAPLSDIEPADQLDAGGNRGKAINRLGHTLLQYPIYSEADFELVILRLDVAGALSDSSRNLLQFAYSARRAAGRVEVFCFGTRLTRITRQLDRRRPDEAMAEAASKVFDWDGGNRIGDSLAAFVRAYARRGLTRGGIVVICSDGLDRGDPEVLANAMESLSRLSHR